MTPYLNIKAQYLKHLLVKQTKITTCVAINLIQRINEAEPKLNLILSFFQGTSIHPQYTIQELLDVPFSLQLAL